MSLKMFDKLSDYDGGQVRMYSGKVFDFVEPSPAQLDILDIAKGLSQSTRWNGQTSRPVFIGEHCLEMYSMVSDYKLSALMHDASEAYMGDLVRPLKSIPSMSEYLDVEDSLMKMLAEKFNFTYPLPDVVVTADNHLLQVEWEHYVLRDAQSPMSSDQVFSEFIAAYEHCKRMQLVHPDDTRWL